MKHIVIGFATVVLLASMALAQDEMAVLNFIVIRDYSGKPIRNASVVMHPVEKNGKQSRGGLQIKTDPDGKASFDGVPYGKLRVQVLATGFQTFGNDYAIDKPTMEITVRMKRPVGQYSIYEDHPEEKKDDSEPHKQPDKDSTDKNSKDKPQ
jgi:Carboxypeptidase regulatory-like domain